MAGRIDPVPMAQLMRGGIVESTHLGHAVVVHADGEIVEAWGDPEAIIYPRSSCKMVQALPLLESGAGAGLGDARLALACASHQGAALHREAVASWLSDIGMAEPDLRCGTHWPKDREESAALVRGGHAPCQLHNNCSGKHTGFLMLAKHLRAGPEYVEPDHPVQTAVRQAFEEVTGLDSPGYGIDGCSAPNFATSLAGLGRAMAFFAGADPDGGSRNRAAARLTQAMMRHPDLVAGEGRACTELMRAMGGRAAIKTGAEAVFVAILPEKRLGIALKITDGGTRASEAAITALLVRHGVLEVGHPAARARLDAVQRNWRGIETGMLRAAPGFP